MTKLEAKKMLREEMGKWGLLEKGWTYEFSRTARCVGDCSCSRKRIRLSAKFVACNTAEVMRNTVLHEIAHALAGAGHGHDRVWKAMCESVGARPERINQIATSPKGKWAAKCPGCGRIVYKHRQPRRGVTSCGVCSGRRYNEKYRLRFFLTTVLENKQAAMARAQARISRVAVIVPKVAKPVETQPLITKVSSGYYMRTQAGEVRVYVTGVGSVDSVKVSGHELRARGQKGLLFTADFVQKNSALVQDGKGKYKNTQQTISKLRGQGREILADTIKEWN